MRIPIASIALCLLLLTVAALAQQVSDAEIQTEIQRRCGTSGTVSIQVQTGVVTLGGTVNSLARRLDIENKARRTVGVKEVKSSITVVPDQRVSDQELTSAVRKTLADNLSAAELKAIQFSVQNGVVTLTGTLRGSYPKQLAGNICSLVPGVIDVKNEIAVRPSKAQPDADILSDINTRFQQNPLIPKQINVSVANGVVTLKGTVDSFVQVDQAEAIARFTPGVIDVKNLLFVRNRRS